MQQTSRPGVRGARDERWQVRAEMAWQDARAADARATDARDVGTHAAAGRRDARGTRTRRVSAGPSGCVSRRDVCSACAMSAIARPWTAPASSDAIGRAGQSVRTVEMLFPFRTQLMIRFV